MLIELVLIVSFTIFGLFIEKHYKIKREKNERGIIPAVSPAELKYNYAGLINERDLTSIVIYLAYKKYIKILPNKIIKLKKYKGNNKAEKLMYKALFKKGNNIEIHHLHRNLYKDISDIVHSIDNKDIRKETNEQEELTINNYLVLLTFIIFLIINIHLPYNIFKMLIITFITWVCFISLVRVYTSKNSKRSKILVTILVILVGLPFYIMSLSKIVLNTYYIIVFVIGHIATILLINILKSLTPRTSTGLELKAEAESFNNYLININKDDVLEMLKINPNFLEDTFPYAYAFNHAFKWKRFLKRYNKSLKWFEGNEIELTETILKIKNQIVKAGHKEN